MLGLLIAVLVVAASVHDNAIGTALLDKVAAHNPSVVKAWVDAGFKNAVAAHGTALGIDVDVVAREPGARGFAPVPKRPAFEDAAAGLRAKDLCESLDAGLEPKQIEGMRAKLKRLVSRGILTEPEPGLFTLPRPETRA